MPGNQIKQGETLTEYVGPGPLPKTGKLIHKQLESNVNNMFVYVRV